MSEALLTEHAVTIRLKDVSVNRDLTIQLPPAGTQRVSQPQKRQIMYIRPLEPHEVSLHCEVRLRALRDAPNAFAETFADAEAQPASYWETLTRSVTEPGPQVMFLACEGEAVCGSTYGLLNQEKCDGGRVGGMWVDPAWRRQGIGRVLLQAVCAWARQRGLKRLGLWAPVHSPAAIALYRQAGFHETGRRRPLPTNPSLQIVEMACELSSQK